MSVKRLRKFLEDLGIEFEILDMGGSVRTVEQACKRLGVLPKNIIKTLILTSDRGPVAVIALGDTKVNFNKIAKLISAKNVRLANRVEVYAFTGYRVGGVPPVGYGNIKTIIDERIIGIDIVYGGGGDDKHLVKLRAEDILNFHKDAIVADIS